MKVAVIDLGTNSVRFDVHQIRASGVPLLLHREKLMVRLGQDVFLNGRLNVDARRRTIQAFLSFRDSAERLRARKIVAFGTSALREASDSQEFLAELRAQTGIEVRIISGAEEARLIAQGILTFEKVQRNKSTALIDIGGGSTEVSLCKNREIEVSESFPLGTARLQQVFLKSQPPVPTASDPDPIRSLRRYIRSVVLSKKLAEEWPKADTALASSGTARSLAKLIHKTSGKKKHKFIERGELKKLITKMSTLTPEELRDLPGMEPKRVDMILSGAILLEEILHCLNLKKTGITDFSLRDGILTEEMVLYDQHLSSNLSLHLEDALDIGLRLSRCPDHLRSVRAHSERLFDALGSLHQLEPRYRTYLSVAAMLHDSGELISPTNHERHSYYVVKHADLPSMNETESELIAQLCLHHRSGKPTLKSLPFAKDPEWTQAFYKLLALLRVADAIDRGHTGAVKITQVRNTTKTVTLTIQSEQPLDLEVLRIEQKKDLFEAIFGRTLKVITKL